MLLIVGTVRIPSGTLAEVLPAMRRMIASSRTEAGCLYYAYALDVLDPGLVHVREEWTDRMALERHFGAPHLAEWRAAWSGLGIGERALQMFEVGAPSPI